jgi:hypothetical protein
MRECVVVVMPAFTTIQQRHPPVVAT